MKILSLLVIIAVPSLRSKSVSDPTDVSVLSVPDRVIGGVPSAGVATG